MNVFVIYIQVTDNFGNIAQVERFIDRRESLDDGTHDFIERKPINGSIALSNSEVLDFHYISIILKSN